MSIDSILALALATFLLAATPGPGVFAVLARAMSGGVRSTIFFIVGVVSGDLVFLLLAILGLAVVANLFPRSSRW